MVPDCYGKRDRQERDIVKKAAERIDKISPEKDQ
jgi:hypothetical protein